MVSLEREVLRAAQQSCSLPLSPQGRGMSPPWQVGAGFPIWLLRAGAGPVPGDGATSSSHPRSREKGAELQRPLLAPRWEAWAEPALALVACGVVQQKGQAAAALTRVEIPGWLLLDREALSPQEDTQPWLARHGDAGHPLCSCRAGSQQVGIQPLSAAWRRPVAVAGFSVGKLRHGAAAVAEPAAWYPSGAPSPGPCSL